MTIANVHSIETFGTVDGPGVRYILFLRGCPLRCKYCHNPDTWKMSNDRLMSVDEVINDIKKYLVFIKSGGVTVSGGEPLLQIDFLIELFKKLKNMHIHTCVDTSGITYNKNGKNNKIEALIKYTDLVLLDLKHIDNKKHIEITKKSNENILAFAQFLDQHHIPMWIRHVLVPGLTTDEKDLKRLKDFINTLSNVKKVEVIPYHTLGVYKYEGLGIEYPLKGVKPPSKKQIEIAKNILT